MHNIDGGSYSDTYQAVLLCFKIEEFIKNNEDNNNPLFSIEVSKSQNIYGLCEYDKKYILLDSYSNGIYIIDIELKQKVAVSVPIFYYKDANMKINIYSDRKAGKGTLYKKILKLKDGQIFITGSIIDIKEQKGERLGQDHFFYDYVVYGDYIISIVGNSIYVFQLS